MPMPSLSPSRDGSPTDPPESPRSPREPGPLGLRTAEARLLHPDGRVPGPDCAGVDGGLPVFHDRAAIMSVVALVIPPFAAIIGNAGQANRQ